MHNFQKYVTRFLCLGVISCTAFMLSGCGGSSDSTPTTTTPTTPTTALAPKSLIGGVLVITYSDARTFTFNISSEAGTGVTRSDAKTSTNWSAYGYNTSILTFNVAYGAFTNEQPANLDNVFDYYALAFTEKTKGTVTIKENTTSHKFGTDTALTGTFTFTTYPPGG